MTKVLVTRTNPGAEATITRLEALGFEPVAAATAIIRPLEATWPNGIEAIAVTSPNGARRAVALSPTRHLPVFAVGDATARVMREAGFGDVTSSAGDGRALARLIVEESAHRRLVHVRGADQSFDLVSALNADGIEATGLVAYAADRVDALCEAALSAIQPGHVILVHSAKGASRFVQLGGGKMALDRLRVVAISADAARPLIEAGVGRVDIAAEPHEDAMLAALCANPV